MQGPARTGIQCGRRGTGIVAGRAAELRPDVVILEISMPELNGLDAGEQIKRTSGLSQ
jgi:DNA-binding NarL/FixJ family response regulator